MPKEIKERVVRTLEGKEKKIRLSEKDLLHLKIPDLSKEKEKTKLMEYLGALCGRGHCKKENGYLVRRHARIFGDLKGKYLDMHKELFGKRPKVSDKGRSGFDVRVNSRGTYEYLNDLIGFNPFAENKKNLFSEEVMNHLNDEKNKSSRRAFLRGFFNTRLSSSHRENLTFNFGFSFMHKNPRVSEFVSDLCEKEGIKVDKSREGGKRRFIMDKDSKLKALDLLDNPYEIVKLANIMTRKEGLGNFHSSPSVLSESLLKADLDNIPPEIVRKGFLGKVQDAFRLHHFDLSSIQKIDFKTKVKGRKIRSKNGFKTKKSVSVKRSKESKKEEKRRVVRKSSKTAVFEGEKIDLEHQSVTLAKLMENGKSFTVDHQLRKFKSDPEFFKKLVVYSLENTSSKKLSEKLRKESKNFLK